MAATAVLMSVETAAQAVAVAVAYLAELLDKAALAASFFTTKI
jgi:hypothetical protein